MSRRKKVASVAFTGVAALGAVGLTAGHAHAAGVSKVTVTPGGKYAAAFTGADPVLVDTTTGNTLTCTHATAAGSLPGSTAGSKVGPVSNASFSNCTLLTIPFKASLNKAAELVATGPTSTGGVTKGELKSISATITGTGLVACHAVITGSLSGSYNNTTGNLTIDPAHAATLTVQPGATGCASGIKANDKAYFAATYAVAASPSGSSEIVNAT